MKILMNFIKWSLRKRKLETYGYKFIRLNKFNVQPDPVKFLDKNLEKFFKKRQTYLSQYKILETVQKTKEGEKNTVKNVKN